MTKLLEIFASTELARYRWMVGWRAVLASVGGFLIANLSVAVLALFADEQRALTTYSATMLSFVIWLLVIMTVFSLAKTRHATLMVLGAMLLMSVVVVLDQAGAAL
jgi:Na+/melibiose symporter-like transporter